MKVYIVSFEKGLQEYDNVELIRLKSPQVNLLIMEDYMPVLGDITGRVQFLTSEEEVTLDDIDGYYMHKKNEFKLILKE